MFEALIITLREGIEAALVVGIVLTYLRATGRAHQARWAFWGLGLALAGSVAAAALLPRLPINQEAYEGALLVAAAVMVASLVVWMARHARGLKGRIEGQVERHAGGRGWGIFALVFLMVLREGAETVLFLAALRLTTDGLWALAGGLLGLALALVFGVAFVKGAVRIDLGRFFRVTTIVLLVFAANLLAGGIHEFAEVGIVPIGPATMAWLGPIVKSQSIFLATFLAIPLLMLVIPSSRRRAEEASWAELEGPERRLRMARARRDRTWRRVAALAGIAVIGSLTVSATTSRFPTSIEPPTLLEPAGGVVRVDTAALGGGELHRFGVALDGVVVRFFVVGSGAGLRVAFDSCTICGARGYVKEGPHVVCLACAADINPGTIGSSGGCNPIPLPYRDDGATLVIEIADLAALRGPFAVAAGEGQAPRR